MRDAYYYTLPGGALHGTTPLEPGNHDHLSVPSLARGGRVIPGTGCMVP
jgi:hypothetical protein